MTNPLSILKLFATILMVVAWLVPNHYPPWSSIYNESCMAIALLLFALSMPARAWRSAALPTPSVLLLIVALIPWVQWGRGQVFFSSDALVSCLYLLGLALAIWVGFQWGRVDARGLARCLAWAMLVASVVSAVMALVQSFKLGEIGIWMESNMDSTRARGNLGQANNLATLIGFGVVGLLYLKEVGQLGRWASTALVVLLIAGASMTQSRTSLVYGLPIVLGLWWWARRGLALRTSAWTAAGFTLFHWAMVWAMALVLREPLSLAEKGLVVSKRFLMWPVMWDASLHSPWWGYGWLQVGAAQSAVASRHESADELYLQAHNVFLDLILWCGYPLGLLLSGLLLYGFVSRFYKVASVEAAAGLCVAAMLGAHALMELPHHYAYFLIPLGLWLGLAEAARGTRTLGPALGGWALLAVGTVLTLALWRDYPVIEEDFRLMRFETMRIGTVRASEPAPHAPFLSSLTGFLRAARSEVHPGMSGAELEHLAQVVKRYPYAGMMVHQAKALALNHRLDEALALMNTMRHIHGEDLYAKVRARLHQEVSEGAAEFAALEEAMPL